ncbi:MAG: hypothetical protein ACKVOP_00285 [Sphingomonadaceae bacterium]
MSRALGLALISLPTVAAAEVKSAAPSGFEIVISTMVNAEPATAYAALIMPARWWNPAHTYSGEARNLTLIAVSGGCFCERIAKTGATIEHGRVVHAAPGSLLRLQAALGPLQREGMNGALSWTITRRAEGGSTIELRYVVGGYVPAGANALAAPVDAVLTGQMDRLKTYLNRR